MPTNSRIQWQRLLAEAAAIVASILLAFAIDAWWDRTQQEALEAGWLAAVRFDLEATRDQINDSINEAEAIVGAAETLIGLLSSMSTPDVATLRDLADRMMQPIGFTPTLPGFERGFAEGRFSNLESVEFRRGLADFRQWLTHFEDSRRLDWDTFFTGPIYQVRAPYAGFQLLGGEWRERFRMSDEEYLGVMLEPETLAAVETLAEAQVNELRGLRGMKDAIVAMISFLEESGT